MITAYTPATLTDGNIVLRLPSDLGQGHGPGALRLVLAKAFGALKPHWLSLRGLAYSARVGDAWHDDIMIGGLSALPCPDTVADAEWFINGGAHDARVSS